MKGFLKTLAAAAIGGAATGAAAVATSPDPAVQGKAAAVGAIVAASTLWVRQKPNLQARGIAAVGLGVLGGAAQAIANGGVTDPQSLITMAIVGAVTGAVAGQMVKAPHQ